MAKQERSIRLRPASSEVLDNSSTAPGELFFDDTTGTLRLFDGTSVDGVSMATRRWTLANTMNRVAVPAAATSTGTVGQMAYTATHLYVCVATDTWVRADLITW